jgi:hypothetical protein
MPDLTIEQKKKRFKRAFSFEMTKGLSVLGEIEVLEEEIKAIKEFLQSDFKGEILNEVIDEVRSLKPVEGRDYKIPKPIKGDPGEDYVLTDKDKKEIASQIKVPVVEKVIEKVTVVKEQPIIQSKIVKEVVHDYDDSPLLDRIAELEEKLSKIKEGAVVSRPVFGGRVGLQVLGSNAKVGARTGEIDFSTGLTVAEVNGRVTVTAGASGATVETPPETPDGVVTAFTVSDEPQYVVADGATFFDGAGYTYSALTVTMDNPVTQYIRIFI